MKKKITCEICGKEVKELYVAINPSTKKDMFTCKKCCMYPTRFLSKVVINRNPLLRYGGKNEF